MSHRSLSFLYLLLLFGYGRPSLSNEINGLKLNEEMNFLKLKSKEVHTWSLPKTNTMKRETKTEAKTEAKVNEKLQKKVEATKPEKLKKKKTKPSLKRVKIRSDRISYNQSAIKKEKGNESKGPFLNTPINDYIPEEAPIRRKRIRSR